MVQHCCQDMDDSLKFECTDHSNEFECPDTLVTYNAKFDEYGLIIHDGGSSSKAIYYCSWCGSKLPDSKRDLWFDTLESLGFDEPSEQNIPKEFKSGTWYKYL
ncbi:DUF6980 family protein [Pseudocolwellia agarivorans]|uniref:DUF6980 family protein n=1 Tax=Pseudocolwellia agarivorans TaxID=1911682 RepID=UPI003F883A12